MQKRLISLLLALIMVFSVTPLGAFAVEKSLGEVLVTVENTTYKKSDGAPWEGTLVDKRITLKDSDTMMSCVARALEAYESLDPDATYISKIHGLKEIDGGSMSGWMVALNDWFTNKGIKEFSVANGMLSDGDEISVMYTCKGFGADLGADYNVTSKALKDLSFDDGTLSPAFNPEVHSYTLALDDGVESVKVTPTAQNKLFKVGTFLGETEYKRSAAVPVTDNENLKIVCGRKDWPTMGTNTEDEQVYTVTVKKQSAVPTAKVTVRSQMANGYLHGIETLKVSGDMAEKYGYQDKVDGVSALDVLVKAHELTFGKDFTAKTASEYLTVGDTGWVGKVFGSKDPFGFFLNEGYPNDGTASPYGGYNGTLINDTAVKNGDTVDFFVYSDSEAYSDYYTWIDAPETLIDGAEATVSVKGFYASAAYLYKDAATLKAAATELEGVQLGWLDPTTGAVTKIDGAVTNDHGKATFTANKASATGYLVALSYGEDDDAVYTIMNPTVNIPVVTYVDVEFKGLHTAQLADIKVYSYENGQKTSGDLLSEKSPEADGYKLKYSASLAPGDYLVEGYDEKGALNGSIVVTVSESSYTFILQRVYSIYATNSSWVAGTDYTVNYKETAPDGTLRVTETGTADNYGTVYTSAIFLEGDTIHATLTPIGEKAADYLPTTITKTKADTTDKGALSLSASVPEGLDIKVTAPKGSTVVTGTFGNYYSYTFFDPEKTTENNDDTLTATFRVPTTGLNHFLRVQNPKGVTYWNFYKWTEAQDITVTREDLHMDDDVSATSVYRFQNNTYDRADIYLNINRQGYKNLSVGESFELDTFRNWQAIESYMNAKIALPDTHYQVLDLSGKKSDLLTITPDAHNSSLATVKANREGTAIVLVTYDAMTHKVAQSSTDNKVLSAIWPECTGVFVVSVGADGSSIATNMTMDRTGMTGTVSEEKLALDAEHDTLFYLDNSGAEYTFTPETGCTVTVARSTVDGTMKFSGFSESGVTTDSETGAVTVRGLTTGRHIIRVEKDGLATYQVITARKVSYDLLDEDGKILPQNTEFNPGDKVTVQFHDLLSPKEKLSGVYNHNFAVYYHDDNGRNFQSAAGGFGGMYDFNGNPQKQKLTITIPKDTTDFTYTLNGAIKVGGFGGIPTHRGVSYKNGMDRQWGTSAAGVLSRLPELTIKMTGYAVDHTEKLIDAIGTVSLDSEDAIKAARKTYDALSDEQKAQVKNAKVLTAAEATLEALKKAEQAEIETVIAKIDAIGTVSLDSKAAITTARTAYDALTVRQKPRVTNYDTLTAAEAKLAALKRSEQLEFAYKTTGDYMESLGTPTVGFVGGEWAALGLARSGRTVPDGYYDNAVAYVKANADKNERLHRSKSTDNSRLILALTAIGKDVTNVGGHNLLKGLYDMAYIQKQGINGPIFALIALDSHNYPTGGDVTRQMLIKVILDAALTDSGWSLTDSGAEVDITAMAITALAPYISSDDAVKAAVDKALNVLSALQLSNGGFGTADGENTESTAQVLVALTALGIDPATDARFLKNGKTALDALLSFYVADGGFSHLAGEERDGMATEQGFYALAAYMRFLENANRLYNMNDVTITKAPSNKPGNTEKPGNSEKPEKPDDAEVPDDKNEPTDENPGNVSPKTGEDSAVYLLSSLLLLSGAAVLTLKKKKNS